ncbi:citrate/2-methylcitrate synthase, partial [Nitratifractor sp.]|uniref:citrate/2-methylcitrate synthase n=1 Tax=Nitratifractor sp. TaxID=2268144 RepID=UPI0025E6FBD8
FNDLPRVINEVYTKLYDEGVILEIEEPEIRTIPKVRRPKNFICTISDDRGEEATYAGYPISSVATPDTGKTIGDVVSLLWFKKVYPRWAVDFIETVIKTVADHGPAVSGAHNAKVTARAGKSVVESLVTGLLTIGPRFGGAIDGAAKYFKYAHDNDMTPAEFLAYMKKEGIPIPGIGHRIKSLRNPDLRVEGLKKFAAEHFPQTPLLDYALTVEQLTTSKKDNLILNVDGTIGILMVDMWRSLGYHEEEIDEFIESGTLNAFFILGRTIGFIGHVLDEKRLAMPMYRHPWDDILYDVQKAEEL